MRIYTLLLAAVALTACTHASTTMLDERHAIVSGRGNAFANQAQVAQTTLVEAAKTTIAHGFRYFSIIGAQDTSRAGVFVTPSQTYSTGTASFYGNTGTYSGQSTTYGGQAIPFIKPGMDVEIYMYKDGEAQPGPKVWDAQSILAAQPKD